jgi:glutamate N-acetyltransferase / amino-acid N-acetyltransferase
VPRSTRFRKTSGGVTAAQGFSAAGVRCGLKTNAKALDLGLILSDRPCSAAGVFTTIKAPAAPVTWDRAVVKSGRAQAIVANSGNANACTGERGDRDAAAMAIAAAGELGLDAEDVCVASTGVIGHPLPIEKVVGGIIDASEQLLPSKANGADFARAIMTTDTCEKTIAVKTVIGGKLVTLGGSCKGAGMISPNMATMLAFITTDAAVSPAMLRKALRDSADASFNCITVDGDMSTNDTVLVLANGVAGNTRISRSGRAYNQFRDALTFVCIHLAKMIVRDGEGATKFVEIRVKGAASTDDAKTAARAIANSPLVKCAIHGGDPNWGRIVSRAAGCGIAFDPKKTRLKIGGKLAFAKGVPADTPQKELAAVMKHRDIEIELTLGLGKGCAVMWTCDFSREYIAINADYHT